MKKSTCQLCGGRIRGGKCELCGWVNQVNREYLLNKSSCDDKSLTHVHREETFSSWDMQEKKPKKVPKKAAASQGKTVSKPRTGTSPSPFTKAAQSYTYQARTNQKAKKKRMKLGPILVLIITLLGVGGEVISSLKDTVTSYIQSATGEVTDTMAIDPEKYDYATRELEEIGDSFTTQLQSGSYVVGVDIPEGIYSVKALGQYGAIHVTDPENEIYLYESMAEEPDMEDVYSTITDVRLYENAQVEVLYLSGVELETDHAQADFLHSEKNPLTDAIVLEDGQNVTVGEDFPEGVYDVSTDLASADIQYQIPLGKDNILDKSLFLDGPDAQYQADTYQNLVLPKGTTMQISGSGIALTPSSRISSEDYLGYYSRYN